MTPTGLSGVREGHRENDVGLIKHCDMSHHPPSRMLRYQKLRCTYATSTYFNAQPINKLPNSKAKHFFQNTSLRILICIQIFT